MKKYDGVDWNERKTISGKEYNFEEFFTETKPIIYNIVRAYYWDYYINLIKDFMQVCAMECMTFFVISDKIEKPFSYLKTAYKHAIRDCVLRHKGISKFDTWEFVSYEADILDRHSAISTSARSNFLPYFDAYSEVDYSIFNTTEKLYINRIMAGYSFSGKNKTFISIVLKLSKYLKKPLDLSVFNRNRMYIDGYQDKAERLRAKYRRRYWNNREKHLEKQRQRRAERLSQTSG